MTNSSDPKAPKLPAQGLHDGIDYDTYAKWDAMRHSVLKHFGHTAAHARQIMLKPQDDTDYTKIGTTIHTAILEPDQLEERYCVAPKVDKRTKAGKEEWANFVAENPDKIVLTSQEWEVLDGVRSACQANPDIQELRSTKGRNEASAVWKDDETGLWCKARIDRLTTHKSWPTVVDLKSTKDAREWLFGRDCNTYGYNSAAAWYLRGLQAIAPVKARRHLIVAVEKTPPFASIVYELDEAALTQGERNCTEWLATYAECLKSGKWPGYPSGVQPLSMPRYAIDPDILEEGA